MKLKELLPVIEKLSTIELLNNSKEMVCYAVNTEDPDLKLFLKKDIETIYANDKNILQISLKNT
jgi:hypothetical protein